MATLRGRIARIQPYEKEGLAYWPLAFSVCFRQGCMNRRAATGMIG